MLRAPLILAGLLLAAAPATASAKPTVAIDQRDHSTEDTVVASVFPGRAAPSGWHYQVALLFENEDEEDEECARFVTKNAYFGRRSFSVRLRPTSARLPPGGADYWCTGRARIGLFIQRNGQPERVKARTVSRWMYFSD